MKGQKSVIDEVLNTTFEKKMNFFLNFAADLAEPAEDDNVDVRIELESGHERH